MRYPLLPSSRADRLAIGISVVIAVISVLGLTWLSARGLGEKLPRAGVVTEGVLKRREARGLAWETVRRGGVIYLGDTLFTGKSGDAVVRLSNRRQLRLDTRTVARVDAVLPARAEVTLFGGQIVDPSGIVVNEPEPVKVAPPGGKAALAIPQLSLPR